MIPAYMFQLVANKVHDSYMMLDARVCAFCSGPLAADGIPPDTVYCRLTVDCKVATLTRPDCLVFAA